MSDYLTLTYCLYMVRWIISGVVMYLAYPLMNKLNIKNELVKLIISSIFGSTVFFKLDKLLFTIWANSIEWLKINYFLSKSVVKTKSGRKSKSLTTS
jgi:hypothetical protein